MDFFEQQENARRMTRRLMILFVLAVLALVILINLALTGFWLLALANGGVGLPPYFHLTNTLVIVGLIFGGTAVEWWNLRDGGEAVARMMNARRVPPDATSVPERRLLNVVEEMAIAAGIAAPQVYVLERESGINAFAAGYGPNEAIVAVSRGALDLLNRDELQGVVAHEFSHILNGDIRLNLRLIAVLYGILLLALVGSQVMSSARYTTGMRGRDRSNLGLVALLLGATLWAFGSIGVFFARIIKASVSRQREYLADASAVTFTRNADGIGGALRKIGGHGSAIVSPQAETLSHLFLGAARPSFAAGWLATHPPLTERIRRIYGRPMASLKVERVSVETSYDPPLPPLDFVAVPFAQAAAGQVHGYSVPVEASAPPADPDPSVQLLAAARDPSDARALVLAMLLAGDHAWRTAQRAALGPAWADLFARAESLRDLLDCPAAGARLSWLDLAMPALKGGVADERAALLEAVDRMVLADGHISLSEFVLETLLSRRLGRYAGHAVPVRDLQPHELRPPLQILLSLLAHAAVEGAQDRAAALAHQLFDRGIDAMMHENLLDRRLGLLARDELDFPAVRLALDTLNTLPPLRKPLLVKAMDRALSQAGTLTISGKETLHMVCAALDVPVLTHSPAYPGV